MAFYLQAHQLVLGTLRACATHASLLGLDVLQAAVQRAHDFDLGARDFDDASIHVTGEPLLSAPQPLRSVVSKLPANAPARHKLNGVLHAPSAHKCASCWKGATTLTEPVLLRCCNEVACRECATKGLDVRSRASTIRCFKCSATLDVTSFIRLLPLQPKASSSSAQQGAFDPAPTEQRALEALRSPPPAAELKRLRVWACSSVELGLLC
jgi:hypothetical protein